MSQYLYFDAQGHPLDSQQHLSPAQAYAAGRKLALQYRTEVDVTLAAFTFHVETDAAAIPNAWYHERRWQETSPDEADAAHQLRLALADLCLYPAAPLETDPAFAVQEANHRAALYDLIGELDRTDLAALFRVARLLVLFLRREAVFACIRAYDEAAAFDLIEEASSE